MTASLDPTRTQSLLDPLRMAVRYIDEHPERWDQSSWGRSKGDEESCGTAFCVAGFIIHQAPEWREDWSFGGYLTHGISPDGQPHHPQEAAAHILGLDKCDAWGHVRTTLGHLFDESNNRSDVQLFAETLAQAVNEVWDVPLPEWAEGEDPGNFNYIVYGDDDDDYWDDESWVPEDD